VLFLEFGVGYAVASSQGNGSGGSGVGALCNASASHRADQNPRTASTPRAAGQDGFDFAGGLNGTDADFHFFPCALNQGHAFSAVNGFAIAVKGRLGQPPNRHAGRTLRRLAASSQAAQRFNEALGITPNSSARINATFFVAAACQRLQQFK
jgi:hypothetical protein